MRASAGPIAEACADGARFGLTSAGAMLVLSPRDLPRIAATMTIATAVRGGRRYCDPQRAPCIANTLT